MKLFAERFNECNQTRANFVAGNKGKQSFELAKKSMQLYILFVHT